MFTYMVASALQRGKRCIIFTDRVELLKQSNGALDQFGIVPTLIEAGKPRLDVSGNCFIAMAQTYARRKNKADYADLMAGMDLVIIDEAHKQTFNPLLAGRGTDTPRVPCQSCHLRDKLGPIGNRDAGR
jgi:hypothetical protein